MTLHHPLTVCLWFDGNAKEAAAYYCAIFEGAFITHENPVVVSFEIGNVQFMAINGGPQFTFNESTSLVIFCDTQDEIDYYWERLCDGGQESRCGWLKDRFGFSWQVVPREIAAWMSDPEQARRVTAAFMPMKKLDIETLRNA